MREMYFGLICKERSLKECFISWLRRIVLRSSLLTLSGFAAAAASVGLDSWGIERVCGLITARAEGISDSELQWEKPWRIALSVWLLFFSFCQTGPCFSDGSDRIYSNGMLKLWRADVNSLLSKTFGVKVFTQKLLANFTNNDKDIELNVISMLRKPWW